MNRNVVTWSVLDVDKTQKCVYCRLWSGAVEIDLYSKQIHKQSCKEKVTTKHDLRGQLTLFYNHDDH